MYKHAFQIEKNHETTKTLGLAVRGVQTKVVTLKELDNSFIYGLRPVEGSTEVKLEDYHTVLDRLIGNE